MKKTGAKRAKKENLEPASSDGNSVEVVPDTNPYFKIGFILICAAILRFLMLDIKPVHFDEGINGHFVGRVWEEGFYRYDPTNFHGPLYFYVLQFAELLFGRSIFAFRFMNAAISVACVYWIACHRRFFGSSALWAAFVMALSAGAVFYGRYAIHESLFVLCQILFSYGYFLWRETRSKKSITFMVTGIFGSFALKETFFIFFFTWGIAAVAVHFYEKITGVRAIEPKVANKDQATAADWMSQVSLGATAAIVLFTGAFLNRKGFQDMFQAFAVWSKTGTGNSGHEKPFFYWLDLLWTYEWPFLLALALTPILFFFSESRRRIVVLTAFGTWLAYSIIPYKTPWLILNLLWPLSLVLGFALQKAFAAKFQIRIAGLIILLALLSRALQTTIDLNFKNFADSKEQYVYVQSTNSMKRVVDFVHARVGEHPEDLNMQVYLFVQDPWPFPWIFSLYPNLLYGGVDTVKPEQAGVILIDDPQREALEKRLEGHKFLRYRFRTRDSYQPGFAYFNFEKFKDILGTHAKLVEGVTPVDEAIDAEVAL